MQLGRNHLGLLEHRFGRQYFHIRRIQTLQALIEVAPDILKFAPEKDAKALHAWTAGRKRALVGLIMIAFRYQHPNRKSVDIHALELAYRSAEFNDYRNDSEIIANHATLNQPNQKRKELWCPIPIPKAAGEQSTDETKTSREEIVAETELKSSLTLGERQAYKEMDALISNTANKTSGIKTPRKEKQSSQELLENAAKVRESIRW